MKALREREARTRISSQEYSASDARKLRPITGPPASDTPHAQAGLTCHVFDDIYTHIRKIYRFSRIII